MQEVTRQIVEGQKNTQKVRKFLLYKTKKSLEGLYKGNKRCNYVCACFKITFLKSFHHNYATTITIECGHERIGTPLNTRRYSYFPPMFHLIFTDKKSVKHNWSHKKDNKDSMR